MKLLFSLIFPLFTMGGSLLRRYLTDVEFPSMDMLVLSYLILAVLTMLVVFDEDELDALRIILFVLGISTLLITLLVKEGQTVIPNWCDTLNNCTTIFMSGFLACYVRLVIPDLMEKFKNRNF